MYTERTQFMNFWNPYNEDPSKRGDVVQTQVWDNESDDLSPTIVIGNIKSEGICVWGYFSKFK